MNWAVSYLPEVKKDLRLLSHSQQAAVKKAIEKVQENPLPQNEGGYGKPLGSKHQLDLTNLMKIKLRGDGIRIVYKLVKRDQQMLIVVIGIREDEEVYRTAFTRRKKYNL